MGAVSRRPQGQGQLEGGPSHGHSTSEPCSRLHLSKPQLRQPTAQGSCSAQAWRRAAHVWVNSRPRGWCGSSHGPSWSNSSELPLGTFPCSFNCAAFLFLRVPRTPALHKNGPYSTPPAAGWAKFKVTQGAQPGKTPHYTCHITKLLLRTSHMHFY